jgi:hypothetical protein
MGRRPGGRAGRSPSPIYPHDQHPQGLDHTFALPGRINASGACWGLFAILPDEERDRERNPEIDYGAWQAQPIEK